MKTKVEQRSSPKLPEPSKALEMLERLKEPLKVKVLAKRCPLHLALSGESSESCRGCSFLGQGDSARPVESRSHRKQRLMKAGSRLGF